MKVGGGGQKQAGQNKGIGVNKTGGRNKVPPFVVGVPAKLVSKRVPSKLVSQ